MNMPKNFWSTAVGALALVIVFLAALSIKTLKEIGYVGVDNVNTINVSGTGDAVAVPDIATFSFSVTETAKTVVDAQAKATDKVNAVLKAVRDGGVADKDIQTQSYSINPHYEYQSGTCVAPAYNGTLASPVYCPPGKSVLTGYEVSQSILVKVRDLSKAGTIFTAIGSLEVTNVNGLDFSVDDPDAVQAEARSKAITDAQTKANELAKELGVHIVRVISFSENGGNSPRPVYYAMGVAAMDSKAMTAPEIPTGEQKVTDSVSITYEIK